MANGNMGRKKSRPARASLKNSSNKGRTASRVTRSTLNDGTASRITRDTINRAANNPDSNSKTKRKKIRAPATVLVLFLVMLLGRAVLMRDCPGILASRRIIKEFQTACNNLDVSGIVDCIQPSMTTNLLKLGAAAAGDEALNTVLEVLGAGSGLTDGVEGSTLTEIFGSLELKPENYGWPKKKRCIKCKTSIGGITQYVNIYVIKYEGDVYISGMEL